MLVCDNGDAIRGIAEVATQLDFIVNGYVGTTATQLSDGQMASAEGDLYLSGADATVVTSITVVNTDSVPRTFTLYLKPSAGTSRAISPVSLDLSAGYSFYTDGQRTVVMNTEGQVVATAVAAAHALGGASHIADTLSNLNSKISDATLVDTASIVLKALFDANTILAATSDNTPAAVAVAASRILGRKASGNIAAMTVAELLTLINVAAGADVTGSNPPQVHEGSHVSGGSDDIDSALAPIAIALTTRGDIVFQNASGLQRLAKGTDGQFLKIGANDPVWADAAAGATVATGTYTGDNTTNRTITHGLGVVPKWVFIVVNTQASAHYLFWLNNLNSDRIYKAIVSTDKAVTAMTTTNFNIGQAGSGGDGANGSGIVYAWIAIG